MPAAAQGVNQAGQSAAGSQPTSPKQQSPAQAQKSPREQQIPVLLTDGPGDVSKRRKSSCEFHDPTDAAHVPPSVLAQHIGQPSIEHAFPNDSKTKRHSISHQEREFLR